MDDTGERHAHIGRDNFAPIFNGDNNTFYAAEAPAAAAARHFAVGLECLRRGRHGEAVAEFAHALAGDPSNPDAYHLAAVAQLGGRKAFLASLQCIRETEGLIHAALGLEDRGEFHYFLAYIRYDYYARKFLRPPAPWQLSFDAAWNKGLTHTQIDSLFTLLSVENPLPAAR